MFVYQDQWTTILQGDALELLATLPDESVQCVVTSPPYWGLRDYGTDGQLGLESTPKLYVEDIVNVFREVRRVLKQDGTLWLNLGDSYAGSWGAQSRSNGNDLKSSLQGGSMLSARQMQAAPRESQTGSLKNTPGLKPKDLVGIPWRAAFALQAEGWWLRQDIIWSKPNPMPESVTDRCTKAHEYVFLLTKSERYYFDQEAIKEPSLYSSETTTEVEREKGYYNGKWKTPSDGWRNNGSFKAIRDTRNKRSVWTIPTQPYTDAHFATFPEKLVETCLLAGSRAGDIVLDPFAGSGTTLAVADRLGRKSIGLELNPNYCALIVKRLRNSTPNLFTVAQGA